MARPSTEKRWMANYPDVKGEIVHDSMYGFMKACNAGREDCAALNYYNRRITHRELWGLIDSVASALTAYGIGPGDVVGVSSAAVPDAVVLIYALNKLGATAHAMNGLLAPEDIVSRLSHSDVRLVFIEDVFCGRIAEKLAESGYEVVVIPSDDYLGTMGRMVFRRMTKTKVDYGKGIIAWKDFVSKGEGAATSETSHDGDATAVITYTGGTTGTPKGVMLTNDSINAVAQNFMNCGINFKKGDVFLDMLPTFTSYGVVSCLHMPLVMGCEVLIMPAGSSRGLGKTICKYRPNHMLFTPAVIEFMMNDKALKGKDLSFIHTLGSGGDTMNEGLEARLNGFMAEHGMEGHLAQGYGLSEVSSAASFCVGGLYKPRSVGPPSPFVEMGIFDPETSEELGYNRVGEICIGGPIMMKGYWDQPGETAIVMRRHDDGRVWIHSGDLGYLDDDGFLFVVGRIKRMISLFNGHKVYPIEPEGAISADPDVVNCCVIGIKDRSYGQGEVPLAVVQFRPGMDGVSAAKRVLDRYNSSCALCDKLAGAVAVESIPITAMGKNDYVALSEEYRDYDYTSARDRE